MPAPRAEPVRVYLLDDHDLVRRGLRDLLAPARDISVVGESRSAQNAAHKILELGVDIMVLDLHLQDGSGVHVCRQVKTVNPLVRGLLVTASDDEEAALASVLGGADGFTTKFARNVDLVGAIRAIASDQRLIEPSLRERVNADFLAMVAGMGAALTELDRTILEYVIEGLTDKDIAERLDLDVASVASHVAKLIEETTGFDMNVETASGVEVLGRHRRPTL